MTGYVLDASVAAIWYLPPAGEKLAPEASQLFRNFANGRFRLIVPDLFWPEFGSVQWKAVRHGRASRQSAEHAIEAMGSLPVTTSPTQPLLRDAFAIAAAFQQSVYDSLYVALAVAADVPLMTADERLVNALGSRFPIRWLGSFQ